MKLLFLALTFLSAIISSGNCAAIAVKSPSRSDSLNETYLKQTQEIDRFKKKELEDIRSTLGEEAYKNANSIIESFPSEQITISFLKAVFDAIKIGAKSVAGKAAPAAKTTHLQEFEKLFAANTSPSWGLKEIETNIPGYKAEIDKVSFKKNMGILGLKSAH